MHSLPPASDEQRKIVHAVVQDMSHVKVDAVAGAGKTTTILHIAAALPSVSVIVLTYNAKLKSETRVRCEQMAIHNVAVHTYHSAALNLYSDGACARDEGIAALLRSPRRTCFAGRKFGLLVVDEAQDMTHLYFSLTRRLIEDVCVKDVRLVVLGDARQSVYGFKGSDTRFLTLADRLPGFACPSRTWVYLTLTTSYRLAPNIAQFVNSQLLDGIEVLKSNHGHGRPRGTVRYMRCNVFGDMPFCQITQWLAKGIAAANIFVLAPSIRVNSKQSPIRMLENKLVRAGVRCYAASSDEERLDEDVTRGKIVFATFHQVKGLERKAVMVFNFDASYHKYYERDTSGVGCPNPIYVAATRAIQHLTLLHDAKQAPLRTVRVRNLASDSDFVIDGSQYKAGDNRSIRAVEKECRTCEIAVTELLKHQRQDVLHAAMACLDLRVNEAEEVEGNLNTLLKSKIHTGNDSWENVAAITGTAIPCMFEYEMTGRCTILTRAACSPKSLPALDRCRIEKLVARHDLVTADFLYIANVHITLTAGFTHKLRQIRSYDWIRPDDVVAMLGVMRHHVTGSADAVLYEFPASLTLELPGRNTKVHLSCAIDCLDKMTKTAFEIKCVSSLVSEHVLQAALNALLLEKGVGVAKGYRHVLMNLCDGCTREIIVGDTCGVMQAAMILLEAKYADAQVADDVMFLASVASGASGASGAYVASIASPASVASPEGQTCMSPNVAVQKLDESDGSQYAFMSDENYGSQYAFLPDENGEDHESFDESR